MRRRSSDEFGARRALRLVTVIGLVSTGESSLGAQERAPVRTRDVELHGVIRPASREAEAALRAYVATPFGRIPVTGHGKLRYTCDGRFSGAIDYNAVVKLLAQLKGIELVRRLEGTIALERPAGCAGRDPVTFAGRARIDSLEVSGSVRIADRSFAFRGITWFENDSHHGVIATTTGDNRLNLTYSMYPQKAQAQLTNSR